MRKTFCAAALAALLGLAGCSGDSGEAKCRAADDTWARATLEPYNKLADAGDKQRKLVAANASPATRRLAQIAVWRAIVDFDEASRPTAPCSNAAARFRTLAGEMGTYALELLSVQRALDSATDPAEVAELRREFLRSGRALQARTLEFNRLAADLATSGG